MLNRAQNTDLVSNQVYKHDVQFNLFPCNTCPVFRLLRLLAELVPRFFRSGSDLLLENVAL
jgi:hypothetical protein